MSTTALVAEFLLIGLIPFLTVFFFVLLILGVYDLSFFAKTKDYSTLFALAATLSIYLLGALTHRLSSIVNSRTFKFVRRVSLIMKLFNISEEADREKQVSEYRATYYYIFQNGSPGLIRKFEYSESLFRIFKSTLIAIPPFSFILLIWLLKHDRMDEAIATIAVGFVLTCLVFVAYVLQHRNNKDLVKLASEAIRQDKPLATSPEDA